MDITYPDILLSEMYLTDDSPRADLPLPVRSMLLRRFANMVLSVAFIWLSAGFCAVILGEEVDMILCHDLKERLHHKVPSGHQRVRNGQFPCVYSQIFIEKNVNIYQAILVMSGRFFVRPSSRSIFWVA